MKYIAIIDGGLLQDCKVVDRECGEKDMFFTNALGTESAVLLKPLAKPLLVNSENGKSVYLSQKHIDILIKFEEIENIKKVIKALGLEGDLWT